MEPHFPKDDPNKKVSTSNAGSDDSTSVRDQAYGSQGQKPKYTELAKGVDRLGGDLDSLGDVPTEKNATARGDSGGERFGGGRESARTTPWMVHVDEEINISKIVKAETESVLTADMRYLLSNNGSPKVGETKTGQPQDRIAKVQGDLPVAYAGTMPVPSEVVPGKTAGITTGASTDVKVAAQVTGSDPVLKSTPVESRPAETGSDQRAGEKLDGKEVRREPASEQKSELPGISSMPFKSEVAKPQTEVKDVLPSPAVQSQGNLLARSIVSPDKVVEVSGAGRNKPVGTSDSVKPNVDAPASAKPALPPLNKSDGGQIKSEAPNLSGIKSGGSLEPGKEGAPSPTRQVAHSDALPGADMKAVGHGPAGSEIGGTKVPVGHLDGGKSSPAGVEGGHKTEVPAPNSGTKIPPKISDGPTEKPQTVSEGPKVIPPRIGDSKAPTGQNSGEKQPVKTEGTKSPTVNPGDKSQGQSPGAKADGAKSPLANSGDKTLPPSKSDGTGSPSLTPGDRTQGQTPGVKSDGVKAPMSSVGDRTQGQISGGKTDGAKTPFANPGDRTQSPGSKIPDSIDGKGKTSGTKAADTNSGTKSDVPGKNDSASDGRTSKITSPGTGIKSDIRTPFGERQDPRTGKEKANPQVDPGSHAESGRPVKGQRETELGTRTPVQRGDTRVPVDPGSRSDKTGKTDIGSGGDKHGTRIGTEAGGSGKSADGKAPFNDGGKKQSVESEPGGSKGQPGIGTRRPEISGTADGATSLSPEASAAAKAKGTGAKVGDGTKPSDPTGAKTGDLRTPQPSGAKGQGSHVPESPGVRAGDTVRMPPPSGARGDGSRIPESPGKVGDTVRTPPPSGAKGEGARVPESPSGRVGDTVRMPPPSGAKGEGLRIPDAPGVRAGDMRAPQQPGGIGSRKPDVGNIKVGETRIPDGIKLGASDRPPSQEGKVNTGLRPPGADIGQNIKGDKSAFNAGSGGDRKSSPGLKEWIISKALEAADAQAKRNPSKIETDKPVAPQSKSPGLPIERGLPSVAKAQPETRAITGGARGVPQARPTDNPQSTIPTSKEIKSPNSAGVSKFITVKLDTSRMRSEAPAREDYKVAESTFNLAITRRIGNIVELPVSAKAVESARIPAGADEAGWKPAFPGSGATESLLSKSRKDQTNTQDQPSDTVPHSIRDVFRKFQFALSKRSFSPEITESGNYVAQPGQSSQRLQAFISSGQHKVLRGEAERSFESRKLIPLFEDDDTEESKDESELKPEVENKNLTDLQFAKPLIPVNTNRKSAQHDSVRKMYIVQVGDTPRSIAVDQLNDHALEDLIVEINKLVFQIKYDDVQGVNVNVLPIGSMILLPNAHDIEKFREKK